MATIRKTTSGRWQAIIRKKGYKPISETFRTKVMAEDWARTREDEMARRTYADHTVSKNTTVAQLLEKYDEEITPRKKSAVKERSRIRILSARLGMFSVAGLAATDVIDYVDERLEDVCSDTIRKELSTLHHAFTAGMALWQMTLPANPVTTAKEILSVTKTLTPGNKRDRRVADWEAEKVIGFSESDGLCAVVWTAIESGMRRGEMAAAMPEHYIKADRTIHIPETKTDIPRTIPLTSRAASVIEQAISQCGDGDTIFRMTADAITRAFNRAKERAGLVDIRFHDLRHEATSRFFEMGLAIEEVALITGHTNWTTLKRYTHIKPKNVGKKLT